MANSWHVHEANGDRKLLLQRWVIGEIGVRHHFVGTPSSGCSSTTRSHEMVPDPSGRVSRRPISSVTVVLASVDSMPASGEVQERIVAFEPRGPAGFPSVMVQHRMLAAPLRKRPHIIIGCTPARRTCVACRQEEREKRIRLGRQWVLSNEFGHDSLQADANQRFSTAPVVKFTALGL